MSDLAFTAERWNVDVIGQINEVRQNPPPGCDPLPPISEFDPSEPWSVDEVRRVQDAIAETCDEITFAAGRLNDAARVDGTLQHFLDLQLAASEFLFC